MRICLVEDSAPIAEMLKSGLELAGNKVTVFADAQGAMTALLNAKFNNAHLPFDILISDLDLGQGIDGAEMIRRLRQFIAPHDLPTIIISGRSLVELNLLSQNLFDVNVVQKPVTPGGLLKEIKRATGAGK